jgi:tetratricopeptide (TPR) repeat protein
MLFDLRGRGRRRTIQAIYLSLAVLMGGGLVLFGIGGNTSGGLFDAFKSGGGSSGANAGDVFTKRLDTLQKRSRTNPTDQAALVQIAKLRFQLAGTGDNYNQSVQAYTDKGKQELRQSADAWQRYLALNPPKPDDTVASLMVQAYGQAGLQQYDKAVQAMEFVIDTRQPSAALYAQLAILAAGAKQDRKSTLAEEKALSLAPKASRTTLKQQIDSAKGQLIAVPQSTPSSG